MKIEIELINLNFGTKQAFKKDVQNKLQAKIALESFLIKIVKLNWIPCYILLDEKQLMKKLDSQNYEIEI